MTAPNIEELKLIKNIISKYRNKILETNIGALPNRKKEDQSVSIK